MSKRIKLTAAVGALIACSALAGCAKTPEGQVVAVVNGEEITLQELNAEISGLNVPDTADKQDVRRRVLQQLVSRRLIVQAAKEDGLDQDPEFIVQQRRMTEQLLVSLYGKKAMETVGVPDKGAIDKYIAGNPKRFGDRVLYRLDQIRFAVPSDRGIFDALKDAHSMDAVAALLSERNIKFERGAAGMDSATVPPANLAQITALPPGEPFVVPSPDGKTAIVSVITGSEPRPLSSEDARPIAVQALRTQSLEKIGDQRVEELKAKAKIEYQDGYAPKEPATGAEKGTAAKAE